MEKEADACAYEVCEEDKKVRCECEGSISDASACDGKIWKIYYNNQIFLAQVCFYNCLKNYKSKEFVELYKCKFRADSFYLASMKCLFFGVIAIVISIFIWFNIYLFNYFINLSLNTFIGLKFYRYW